MSNGDIIKWPARKTDSRVEKALSGAKKDGSPQRLLEMGFSTAEQTARSYNADGSPWVLGYSHEKKGNELISVLWGKYVA